MALRVYLDGDGHEWRVWMVTPTGGADVLGASFREGWLCFERTDGTDRRRLSMTEVPPAWDALSDARLDLLRRIADPATRRSAAVDGAALRDETLESRQRGRASGPKSMAGGDDADGAIDLSSHLPTPPPQAMRNG
jgi:hypothetical protein